MAIVQNILIFCTMILQAFGGPASNDRRGALDPRLIIDFPSYPATDRLSQGPARKRSTEPQTNCDWTYGIAYTEVTRKYNINDRLEGVKDSTCVASPNSCTRVAYLDQSGIFLCNNHPEPIVTECENLIDPAKILLAACNYGDYYTFGVLDGLIKNGTEQVSFHLRIAAEGW